MINCEVRAALRDATCAACDSQGSVRLVADSTLGYSRPSLREG